MKCQKSGENLFQWAHLNENILVLHFLYIYRCTIYRVLVYGSLDILYPHRLWFIISSLSGSGDPVWWVRAHLSRPGLLSVCPGPGFLSVSPCLRVSVSRLGVSVLWQVVRSSLPCPHSSLSSRESSLIFVAWPLPTHQMKSKQMYNNSF